MDDQVLIHILETACSEENLIFQVVEQECYLHVFLNREPGQVLDYQIVGKKIYRALSRLSLTDIEGVCLYSRVLGEEEPDWEAKFRLPQAKQGGSAQPVAQRKTQQREVQEAANNVRQSETAQSAEAKVSGANSSSGATTLVASAPARVAAPVAEAENYPLADQDGVTEAAAAYEAATPTVSAVAEQPSASSEDNGSEVPEEEFELADYCFIRNRMLLTADILPPSKAVAAQVNGFHGFSMTEKQRMMPQLELFFKGAPGFSAENLNEAQQQWFKDAEALTGDDTRKAPIWLSRYCLDAESTLAVMARVLDPSLAAPKQEDEPEVEASPEMQAQGGAAHSISGAMTGATSQAPPGSRSNRQRQQQLAHSREQSAPAAEPESKPASQWLWPGIVVISSIALMCLGMLLAKPSGMATGLCEGSDSPEQCHLATQIVADQELWDAMTNDAVPLPTDGEMQEAGQAIVMSDCSLNGAMNAGHPVHTLKTNIAASRAPQLQEILPGIVLADVEYPRAGLPGTLRTACVFSNEVIPASTGATQPFEIASAVIPVSWPAEPYDNSNRQDAEMRVEQAFNPLFTLGSTLLFTTVGLFAAVMLRLAITTYSFTALSQAAIVMTIVESIFDFLLPLNGLLFFPFIAIARKSLALGLTGAIVPGFKVDWSGGYLSVAACVGVMALVRFVLRWLMILTILSGAGA